MCGISGFFGSNARSRVQQMCDLMAYRGPDDSGFYEGNGIVFGQRRLSIIDLSGGRQPILNETGRVVLVCNGEI